MRRDYSPENLSRPADPLPATQTRDATQKARDPGEQSNLNRTSDNRSPSPPSADSFKYHARSIEPRQPFELRSRVYRLRNSEIRTMVDIGRFRALVTKDLEELAYSGNRPQLQADLANLPREGLITLQQLPQKDAPPRRVVALTKEGRRLLILHGRVPKNQAIYYGFSKLREADHDADLYRLYQKALNQISQKGAKRPGLFSIRN